MVNPGTEIIDLLSDDSGSDIEEYVQSHEGTPVGSHKARDGARIRRDGHTVAHIQPVPDTETRIDCTPTVRARVECTPTVRSRIDCTSDNRAPDTPDLPSPSLLLGLPRHPTTSPTIPTRTPMPRQMALDLPSSPPLSNALLEFLDARVESDDCHILDIGAESDGWSDLDNIRSARVHNRERTGVEFSDAVATEILGSESEDSDDGRINDLLARASALTKSLRGAKEALIDTGPTKNVNGLAHAVLGPGRRAYSATEPVSVSTLDTSLPPSEVHDRRGLLDSSSSVHIPWSDGVPEPVSCSQAVTRKEKRTGKDRALLQERKRQEREFARGVSLANRKKIDASELARNVTIVVDPGVLHLLKAKDVDSSHAVFGKCTESEMQVRIEESAIAGGVWWEVCVRRVWDARLGLFVPIEPITQRVRRAAMVVVGGAGFTQLVASGRLIERLEIWRAALKATRLFVCVLGLQKLVRRAADEETREFARQMRSALTNSDMPQRTPRASTPAVDVEAAVLKLQVTCPYVSWITQCADSAAALSHVLWQTSGDVALAEHTSGGSSSGETEPIGDKRFVTSDVASSLRVASVRTGTDLPDSWVRALTQIPKVAQPVAQSIACKYPTPHALFSAWHNLPTQNERELLLASITVSSSVSNGRRLGPVMSTRIFRTFNERDPCRPFAEL
ncbi:hypothetical protein LPJ58_003052 [Coemansia sp. RSA 1591]|nr:hypothetical protein LPJ58_003052 [Coemansia sp. RSA 1591]KAJ2198490.1 hypothetical protein IW144_001895 [Coemansia sp. RSA 522]